MDQEKEEGTQPQPVRKWKYPLMWSGHLISLAWILLAFLIIVLVVGLGMGQSASNKFGNSDTSLPPVHDR